MLNFNSQKNRTFCAPNVPISFKWTVLFFFLSCNLCLIAQSDECGVSAILTPGTSCASSSITGSTVGFTDSTFDPTCGSTQDDDGWYFINTTGLTLGDEITIEATGTGGTDLVLAVVATDAVCSTTTEIDCEDANGGNGTETITFTYNNPTTVYMVFLFEYWAGGATFDICAYTGSGGGGGGGAPNDDCITATSLTENGTCIDTASDLANATDSGIGGCAGGSAEDDVWFSFVATSTNPIIEVSGGFFDDLIELFSGTCAGGLTSIDCEEVNTLTNETMETSGLTIGQTYYFRIYDWSTTPSFFTSFDVCVYSGPTPAPNDDCNTAISLTQNATCQTTSATLENATDSGLTSCWGTANDDVWFSFVATSTNPIIEVGNTGFDPVVEVFSGTCTGGLTSIDCADDTGTGSTETISTSGLTIGQTYFVRVYHWSSFPTSSPTFDICIFGTDTGGGGGGGDSPADCIGASVLCSNGSVVYNPIGDGDVDDFDNPNNDQDCLSSGNPEHLSAWYYFEINETTPAGATLSFDIIPDDGAFEDYDFAIFGPDVDCDNLGTAIRCSFAANGAAAPAAPGSTGLGNGATDTSEGIGGDAYVAPLIVQPGQGYFLLIDNYSSSNQGFTLNFGGTASLECDTDPPCGIITNAGTDAVACTGGSVTLNGSQTGATGGENYTWTVDPASASAWIANPNSMTTVVNIPAGATIGNYTFTLDVTEGTCTNTDPVVIDVQACCMADAGTVTGAAQNVCPGNTVNAGVIDNETDAAYTQTYLLVNAAGNVVAVDPSGTFTLNDCTETYTIYSYNYLTAGASPTNPSTIASIDCTANCCDLEQSTFNVSAADTEAPVFTSPPANTTVDCDAIPAMNDLTWTDNCDGTGTVSGSEGGTADPCGYDITRTWTYTDACNNPVTHTQTITVNPAAAPAFVSVPSDMTIDCDAVPATLPTLNYDNNMTGSCAISGTETATQSGTYDACGGSLIYTWTFTDACNNTITENQTLTILPAPAPTFVSMPADMTVDCDAVPTTAPSLNYDNNESGTCAINGSVAAVEGGSYDECGGAITYTWTYTDDCNTITYMQNITVNPAPEATFATPPANVSVDCNGVPAMTDLTYTNSVTGTCAIAGMVTGTDVSDGGTCPEIITRTWTFTDNCSRTITVSQQITVTDTEDPVFATPPADAIVPCGGSAPAMTDLTWTDNCDGTGMVTGTDMSNGGSPEVIIRTWTYTDACGNTGTATQQITINEFNIDQALAGLCDSNGTLSDATDDTFDVTVDASIGVAGASNSYTVSDGTTNYGPFTYGTAGQITNLPADGTTITLTFTDSDDAACTATTTVSQASCSTTCALTIDAATAGTCNDGGTPSDPSDDTFIVDINASIANGGTMYNVSDGTMTWGPFSYGTGGQLTGLPADGSTITLTFTDADNAGCQAQTTVSVASCSTQCALNIDQALAGLCDDNGTLSDATDDTFDLTVNASAMNGGADFNVSDGTTTWGPFAYGTGGQLTGLPADGSTITLTFSDVTDPTCTATTTVSQASCSTTCALTIDAATAGTCNDGGTPSDPSDDTFIVDVNASIANGGTMYNVSDGTMTWGPFSYGTGGQLTGLPADGSTITLTFTDADNAGCQAQTTVSVASCSTQCALNIDQALAGLCDDNGTLSDATDDTFDLTVNASAMNGGADFNVSDGTMTWGPFAYGTGGQVTGLPADGSTITLTFSDVTDPTCTATTTVSQASCSTTCALTIDAATAGLCNDGGTPSDPSDDTFIVDVNASIANGGTMYNVSDGTMTWGPFSYGTGGQLTGLPADGSTITLTFTDADNAGCQAQTTVSVASCSTQCALNIDQALAGLCDDNGTLSDATDDIFDLTVNASAMNGGADFNVSDGTTTWGPFAYGTGGQVTGLPADGSTITLTFSDVNDPTCTATTTVSQASCSTTCALTIDAATAGTCNDGGTPSDPSDDTFIVDINASIANGGTMYNVSDGTMTWGPFAYGTGGQLTGLPADGSTITLTFTDADNAGCQAQTTVSVASCSNQCAINIDQALAGLCDDNGTLSDATDDIFDLTVNASAMNGGADFNVSDGTTTWGPFAYGTGGQVTGLPADGSTITLTFSDVTDPTCTATTTVSQASCSTTCALTIDAATAGTCNDGGTPSDASDDTFDVSVNASIANGGTMYNVSDGTMTWGPFSYGTGGQLTGLPADGSTITLTFTDADNAGCQAQTTVSVASCSNQCAINIDQALAGLCDDNGTLSDATDDIFDLTVNASAMNGGADFNVSDGTTTWGPFAYGTGGQVTGLPADGSTITLTFSDVNDPTCTATTTVSQASCSTTCALTIDAATAGTCNDGGTPSDPSDDTFIVDVNASIANGGTMYNVSDGTMTWGPFSYGTGGQLTGLPADGSTITLTFTDADNAGCQAQTTVSVASCSTQCALNIDQALAGLCDDNGTLSDATDDIFDLTVNASAMNGGADFNVSDGTTTWGPFAYGTGGQVTGLPADGSTITLTFSDVTDPTCTATTTVSQASCSTTCALTIDAATAGTCNDGGTPSDPSDDTFIVDVNASIANGGTMYNVSDGTMTWGPFAYGTGGQLTGLPADGSTITLTFTDADNAGCQAQTTVSVASCSTQCALNIDQALAGLCDDNGTLSDATDDTFDLTVNASAMNGGADFNVSDGTMTWGPFAYGTGGQVTGLPADGSTITLTFSDVTDPICTATTTVSQASCSTTCALTIDAATAGTCNDGGTPSDPSDDTFIVDINASIANGGTMYNVSDGTMTWGPFAYGTGGQLTGLPADGSTITLTFTDADNAGCQAQTTVSVASCSTQCALNIDQALAGLCDDNGTLSDATDDIFDLTVNASAMNGGADFNVSDGTTTWGPFAYGTGGQVTGLPADGSTITLTFSDVTDPTCTATTTISQASCSSQCLLSIDAATASVCNDGGTASDPSDDTFTVDVNASALNGGTMFNVSDGTMNYGPFTYGIGGELTNLPANGTTITLTFTDINDPTCAAQTTVSVASCSNQCVLTIDQAIAGLCQNNGTPSDASDDTFDVTIAASALNQGSGYTVSDGTMNYGPFAYGTAETILNLPADGSTITLTFTDNDDPTCTAMTTISQAACSNQCVINSTTETVGMCQDNGTPSDATDDTFDVNVDATALNGATTFTVTNGIATWGPFAYGTGGVVTGLLANGSAITLTYIDGNDAGCTTTATLSQTSCSNQCALTIEQAQPGLCDNNGTLSDASDDTYSVTVNASALNGNGTYQVSDGIMTWGPFAYNTAGQITNLPANGSTITLTFSDVNDPACTATTTVSQVSCSTDCVLNIEDQTIGACNDGGTPTDASDDTYDVTVDASAVNGGTTFTVTDGTTTWGPFAYGTGGVVTGLPANGMNITLTFTDVLDGGCSNQTIVNQSSCSDECALTIIQATASGCNNNGTTTDASDDTFSVFVQASILNGGTTYTVFDGTTMHGPFTYATSGNIPDLPADGTTITLTFTDVNDPMCTATTTVSQMSCSNECALTITNSTIGACNDNGTASDSSDDTFGITIAASAINGNSNYFVTDGTQNWGPFNYNTDQIIDGFPAGGVGTVLTVYDAINTACAAQINVNSPSCSDACALTIDQAIIGLCDNNGTLSDATDDTFEVTINASALNGGTSFTVFNGATNLGTFDYATGGIITGLPADGSTITLTVTDIDDPMCSATTDVSQVSCSTLCTLTIDELTAGICNDNGTPSDATDDIFDVTVNASATNGNGNFMVTDGTNTWGPYAYGVGGILTGLPADGSTITLTFTDEIDGGCANQQTISQASCSDACALTIDQAIIGLCDNNGTLSDATDDTFEVTINASALNGGTSFTVFNGATNLGTFDYATGGIITGLPADGSTITLTVTDIDDPMCSATTDVSQVSCSTLCTLTIDELTAGICNDNGTPSDATDDIFDVTVNASATNGNGNFMVTDGTNTWGPYAYGVGGILTGLPADGSTITLTFTDEIDGGCANQQTISQASCSDACALTIDQAIIGLCDNNGTLSDATDDTFEVTINASALNGGTSFTVFNGATNLGTFDYATGGIITGLPADGSTITLTVTDIDDPMCSATTDVSQVSCSTLCTLTIDELTAGICNDNGTPSDATDDIFDVTVNASATNGNGNFMVTDGTNTWGPYAYGVGGILTGLPADGSTITLTFTDEIDGGCANQQTISQASCSDACALTILEATPNACDNQGTLSDSADDTFSVNIDANSVNGSGTYMVTDGTTTWGPFVYNMIGNTISDLPANGSIITLTFTDAVNNTCTASIEVSQNPCSTSCVLTVDNFTEGNCNNNGTLSDGTDDTFDVTINASSLNGGGTYSVSDGTTNYGPFSYGTDEIIANLPANGTNITLTFTDDADANCNAQIVVNQNACSDCSLTAEAGNGTTLSCAVSEANLMGSSNEANVDFEWTGPAGFAPQMNANTTTTISGWYYLEVSNMTTGCTAIDSVFIDENDDLPSVTAMVDGIITCDNEEVMLTANTNVMNPTFEWISPTGITYNTATITVNEIGDFSVIVTDLDANCASSPAIASVESNITPPLAIIQDVNDELNCATIATGISLNGTGSTVGDTIDYQWILDDDQLGTDLTEVIFEGGLYYLIVSNSINGCVDIDSVNIAENVQFPIADAGLDAELNCYADEVQLDGSNSTILPNIIYVWDAPIGGIISGETTSTPTVGEVGEYILTVTDTSNMCTNMDTVFVNDNTTPPIAIISDGFNLDCVTTAGTLGSTGSSTGANISYQWSNIAGDIPGAINAELAVNAADTYTLFVFNTENGCSAETMETVDDLPADITLETSLLDPLCFGDNNGEINIDTIIGANPPFLVGINGGTLAPTTNFGGLTGGTYTLTIEDAIGCQLNLEYELTTPTELSIDAGEDQIITLGETVNVNVVTNNPVNTIDVMTLNTDTLFNCNNCPINLQPTETTEYIATIVNENGCTATDVLVIQVTRDIAVYMPNAFSPNDDGVNDLLYLFASQGVLSINEYSIFDRWGEQVHRYFNIPPNDATYGWDGMHRGQKASIGVYVWYAEVVLLDGSTKLLKGDVTLVR